MKRRLLAVPAVLGLIAVAYFAFLRGGSATPRVVPSRATAMIGSGSDAVAVDSRGRILAGLPAPAAGSLPRLPLETPPRDGRLHGPVLEQAEVLGAAPPALRPYLEGSHFGESGVDVALDSGIELRFGNASQARRKWRAVAAVLADPTLTSLDYVNVQAPSHPAIAGSGHALPPPP